MHVFSFAQFRRVAFAVIPPVVAICFTVFALSFSTWYEGGTHQIGVAERLFGSIRVLGWRGDIVWVFVSTAFALATLVWAFPQWKVDNAAKRSALLSTAWLVGSVFYFMHVLDHMLG